LLVGDGKVGKTFAVLHMAVAVAAGLELLWGLKCLQRPVLIVLAEDDYGETKARLEGICAALGVALEALPVTLWCLPSEDLILARVGDNGGVSEGPFLRPLLNQIVETGARCVILDPLSDFADLDESKRLAANAYCKKVIGPISHKLGVTVIQTGHPSKASMADGSVVSGTTAWKNAVRNVLSMERLADAPKNPKRILRNAWTNYGEERELELYLAGGVLYQSATGPSGDPDHKQRFRTACVETAISAAETGQPLQKQRRPPDWVFKEIERLVGHRPTLGELRNELAEAQRDRQLRYLNGSRHRVAGYYPFDPERAAELARETKQQDSGGDHA